MRTPRRILAIGAGPGGIIAGHRLRAAGHDVVILEKSGGVGGTWRRNRYPGLACDIPSHLYSFSFALKPDWTRPYASQPEILAYLEKCVDDFGLRQHIRLDTSVRAARWDGRIARWRVTTAVGEELLADVLVSSQGMFGEALWPDIAGRDTFAGAAFHTAAWPHDHSLTGQRVAVIGSAASAVQLIPEVAKEAARLHVFQRSANWVLPKDDVPFTPAQIDRFIRDRAALEAERAKHLDQIGKGFAFVHDGARRQMEEAGLAHLAVVTDPALRARLTPTVPWGCQRPLFSNDYYPTFNRRNVELVTDPIDRITPTGIVTRDGRERPVDAIVYATGYETTRYASTIDIVGRGGRSIGEAWADGALAYLGITVSGFPNFFLLYGPNTNHGSIIYMIECQVDYIVRMLGRMEAGNLAWVDIRPEVMAAYNERLQSDLDKVTVWDAGCHQYYRSASGRIITQWPHSMYAYRDRTLAPDPPEAYEVASLGGAIDRSAPAQSGDPADGEERISPGRPAP